MKKVKKHVYRIGDKVRILKPMWIHRVGYPLIWTDLIEEVEADPRTAAAMTALGFGGYEPNDLGKLFGSKAFKFDRDFIRAVARMRVEQRGFGGKERKLIYEADIRAVKKAESEGKAKSPYGFVWLEKEPMDYTGFGMEVTGKRVVKTGTYYPPSGGRGYYPEDDGWYESGGLENPQTHVLLSVGVGEIEACNVEPW